MRNFPLFIATALLLAACQNQDNTNSTTAETTAEPTQEISEKGYDEQLALEVGADEYGMKSYVMAFLKRGPNRDRSPEEAQALQRAHLDNMDNMVKDGKLVMAGPFLDDGELRGIYVFNVATIEEAQALTETDPAIQAGSLVMELHPWYGSAALVKMVDMHARVAKKEI